MNTGVKLDPGFVFSEGRHRMNGNDALGDVLVKSLVSALETARRRGDATDLSAFLPRRDHPLFLTIRRELLLVDLNHAWQMGKRRLLLDYVSLFPDLREDAAAIEAVAFAEFRWRLLAGEDPSPAEYEWQYKLLTTNWVSRANEGIQPSRVDATASDPKTELAQQPEPAWTRIVQVDADGIEPEINCDVTSRVERAIDLFPAVGTQFLSFQLIAELGRGGFGRVYLARQGDLAHRLVALKITVDLPGEEQKLAQLQHTNVVPIFSYHQSGDLHAVCMPYFGATTLADVVRVAQIQAKIPGSGQILVDIVRARRNAFQGIADSLASQKKSEAGSTAGPGLRTLSSADLVEEDEVPVTLTLLEEATYVEAVLWIAERLTEGLSHAHEHGILHRDLKPANILLTDDGQPMLLDFNLSADTKPGAGLQKGRIGGTLPYMAPEQLAGLAGIASKPDERCDVYAIGVILYELLTGRAPFTVPAGQLSKTVPGMIAERMQPPPRLRTWNSTVSYGVESIVRHCLEGAPERRYQSARHLREDLKRQRQHRPLRHAPEPSFRERLQKWGRRHPRLVSPASLGAMTTFVLLLSLTPYSWQTWKGWQRQHAERDGALVKSKEEIESARVDALQKAEAMRKYQSFRDSLGSARIVMESVNAIQVFPKFMKAWACEETRLHASMALCRASLDHYGVLKNAAWRDQPLVAHLPPAEREQLRRHVVELLFVLAQGEQVHAAHLREQVRLHDPVLTAITLHGAGQEAFGAWQAFAHIPLAVARDLNERARQCCDADMLPRALLIQHAELTLELGDEQKANHLRTKAESTPLLATMPDAYWSASLLAAKHEFKQALPLLNRVVRETPGHYGAWLLRGVCLAPHFSVASLQKDQKDRQEALECFTTCIVMQPKGMWAYYHRGLVSYHLNLNLNAIADFNRILHVGSLKNQPAFATAFVPRATALMGIGKLHDAERDLNEAIEKEPDVPEFYFLRAGIREKLRKHADARCDEEMVIESTPTTAEGWTYRGMVRLARVEGDKPDDPFARIAQTAALADFDKALKAEPAEPLTLFLRGRLLAIAMDRPKEAIVSLSKALAIKPDYVEARTMRSLTYAALGERDLAHKDVDMLIESEPSPQTHYQIARVYAITFRSHPKETKDAQYALGFLAHALRYGYGVQTYRKEPDLAPLRNMPEFELLGLGLQYLGEMP